MKKFRINVNGNTYEVEVEDITSGEPTNFVPVNNTPVVSEKKEVKEKVSASAGQEVIEAPMPGNIWKVLVKDGDQVKAGDVLLILEAMKMENEILAPRDGKVVAVNAVEGSTVDTGEELVILG